MAQVTALEVDHLFRELDLESIKRLAWESNDRETILDGLFHLFRELGFGSFRTLAWGPNSRRTYSFADSIGKPDLGMTDLNCLLYLEMCDKVGKLPSPLLLENQSNYVTSDNGSKQVLGSLCLSSKILFESYLLPFFQPIVKEAELSIQQVKVTGSKSFLFAYAFGQNSMHLKFEDDYFLMKRQSGSDDIYQNWFNNNKGESMKNLDGWRWVNEYKKPEDKQFFDGKESTFQLTGNVLQLTLFLHLADCGL